MTTQQFPALVFRSPGPHRHSSGGAYRFAQVNDADELAALLAQGFHADVRAAIVACGERAFTHGLTTTQLRKVPVAKLLARLQAKMADDAIPAAAVVVEEPAAPQAEAVAEPAPEPAPPADDAPPTRSEMLQQAQILGIKADKRWSDATLMAKINEAMNPI
jgi:hypothetical protein